MPEIQKVRYTHDALIDSIIANPSISQGELAREFGFSQAWMSIIINSDAFQERLATRKAEIVDPTLVATVKDRLEAVAKKSLERLAERLELNSAISNRDLVEIAKFAVGDRNLTREPSKGPSQSLYVVMAPPKAETTQQWVEMAQEASS